MGQTSGLPPTDRSVGRTPRRWFLKVLVGGCDLHLVGKLPPLARRGPGGAPYHDFRTFQWSHGPQLAEETAAPKPLDSRRGVLPGGSRSGRPAAGALPHPLVRGNGKRLHRADPDPRG